MRTLVATIFILAFSSCNKDITSDIFYAEVSGVGSYYGYDYQYDIDIDLDNDFDFKVTKNEYFDNFGNVSYSITFADDGGKSVEFAAIEDCMTFISSGKEISDSYSFEKSVTLANNFAIPCNPDAENRYIAFRIRIDDDWHYGWMEITYNLTNNMELNFHGWAYHKKRGKTIETGQME